MTYLALVRHGETAWNRSGRFTGWADEALTAKGRQDARAAGAVLARSGIGWHEVHTSKLRRAVDTAAIALGELPGLCPRVVRDWRLNERHVGALEGGGHAEFAALHGRELVEQWRWGWDVRPPAVAADDPRQSRHRDGHPEAGEELPVGESLQDVVRRVGPWLDGAAPRLAAGANLVAVTHGTTLRALRLIIEGRTPEEMFTVRAGNGAVVLYALEAGALRLTPGPAPVG
ncbi:2,3-bisphosphoglycerate-dependent phosphoglycerate mutase [Kitasatospora sp. NPDC002227]|uniref:2,3-bisphosphoglycerate-dependent phosphoglycerate mutase n=1 Tax=Kitasatospora sp. NPDC002227 TaxID=3154773 RepID=UPI0033236BC9